jgi:NADH-quinone oxidoreductase subunit H
MDLGWKVLIPISLGWFLLLAALREFSPDGDVGTSARVVLISFAVAVVAVAIFGAALQVSARNRFAAHDAAQDAATSNTHKGAKV